MPPGLDVFVNEPEVPKEYLELDNVMLFPHLGSSTVHTRQKMEQLVVDNLLAWAERQAAADAGAGDAMALEELAAAKQA